jgi:hypothetical protein
MLVTFSTKAYSDITMFGDSALTLIKMMGHSGTIPSAILAADVPMALTRLSAAVNALKADVGDKVKDKDNDEVGVSLAQRSVPLINLLSAAVQENTDVMWK